MDSQSKEIDGKEEETKPKHIKQTMIKKTRRRVVYGYLKVPSFEILNDNLTITLNNHLQTHALTQTPSNEVFSNTSSLTPLNGSNNQDESACLFQCSFFSLEPSL